MHRGYSVKKVKNALDCLCRSSIPFGISLMFGAPGETPETISETFKVINQYSIPQGIFVTIGLNLWTDHQQVLEIARKEGQLLEDNDLFNEVNYISPDLPKEYMIQLINSLSGKEKVEIQVNKPYAETME